MSNDNVAHALSGAGGGALAMVVTYPLITLSTRAQTEVKKAAAADSDSKPISAIEAAKKIIAKEGASGLYSGLSSALFGISVTNFVYYYFYEGTKSILTNNKVKRGVSSALSTPESMLVGAVAGSAACVLTNPIWVVNTRMTVKKGGEAKTTLDVVKKMISEEGLGSFFAGILPALILVVNPIIQYTIFEQLKNIVEKKRKLSALDAFYIGAIGKIVATTTTYPYITLKSRLQVASDKSVGLISGLKKIIANEGITGLYRGLDTKVVQSTLTSAFLFFFKEQLFSAAVAILLIIRSLRGK